ncbi:glycosyltransferase family 2 protein [Polaromonas sp.]|uniref:glycosyltransferase n=1 Tax=Polaromonas sp. TaxID=1869339 RepID=UPI00352A0395
MIGIIIPAHDEEQLVASCLHAALSAGRHKGLCGEAVEVLVVLDACSDSTTDIVTRFPVGAISVSVRNVGMARAAGAEYLLARGARWLAFTDADTRVAEDWLFQQLEQQADVVCGTVAVDDWSEYCRFAEPLQKHFRDTYEDADGHRHIHGANLGVCSLAYRAVGGFAPLESSEDVALVNALLAVGAKVAWSAAPRVVTSARRMARAPAGFAAALGIAVGTLSQTAM